MLSWIGQGAIKFVKNFLPKNIHPICQQYINNWYASVKVRERAQFFFQLLARKRKELLQVEKAAFSTGGGPQREAKMLEPDMLSLPGLHPGSVSLLVSY